MDNTHKTSADIIAEMRRGTRLPGYWRSCDVNEILQYHADRLEAALKREAIFGGTPRVCDVNTLESLSDFVEKTILTSDLLKDTHEIVKSIVVASVRTALAIAYEPAKLERQMHERGIVEENRGEVFG